MAHTTAPHAPLFCSFHILMRTMMYFQTDVCNTKSIEKTE